MVSIPSYCRPDLERKYTKEGYGITCYHANPALLYRDSKVNLSDLPTGRSNIWLAGEIKGNHTPFGYPYNWRALSHPINFGPDSFGGWQDGATFVLADGSIKFIKNNIDESVLKNIANTVPLPAMELYDIPSRRFECGAASSQLKIECPEIKDEHSKGGPPHSVVYFSADERADFIDFVHGIVNVEEVIKNYPQAKTLRAAYPQNQNELELICGLKELETLGLMSQFEFPDRPKPAQIGLSNVIIGLQQLPKLKFLKLRVSQIELGGVFKKGYQIVRCFRIRIGLLAVFASSALPYADSSMDNVFMVLHRSWR